MKNLIVFLFFNLVLVSCNVTTSENKQSSVDAIIIKDTTVANSNKPETQATESNNLITCNSVGPINLSDDNNKLLQLAGKENITLDSNYTEGEFTGTYNTLWKGSPKELKVYWEETSTVNKKVGAIEIENEKSIYQFANGVKIGSTLDELVKMNNDKPIRFYGFDWDYGGMIINEGKGIGQYDCFSGKLNYLGNSIDKKFLGDKEVSSSTQGIPLKKIYLSSISISKPDK